MTSRMYEPTDAPMTPIEGFTFYADALRGGGSIDGRSEKHAINSYIEWALTVDPTTTTEKDILPMVEKYLSAYVTLFEYTDEDGSVVMSEPAGHWHEYVEEEYEQRELVRRERELQALDDAM